MSIFSGDDFEIECNQDTKTNQFLCVAKKGDKQAVMRFQITPDGNLLVVNNKGSVEMQKKIKEYAKENIKIKPKLSSGE